MHTRLVLFQTNRVPKAAKAHKRIVANQNRGKSPSCHCQFLEGHLAHRCRGCHKVEQHLLAFSRLPHLCTGICLYSSILSAGSVQHLCLALYSTLYWSADFESDTFYFGILVSPAALSLLHPVQPKSSNALPLAFRIFKLLLLTKM